MRWDLKSRKVEQMYTDTNYKTKKALKADLASGKEIHCHQPGNLHAPVTEGKAYLEGPHYPQPHRWYASCTLKAGVIVAGTLK